MSDPPRESDKIHRTSEEVVNEQDTQQISATTTQRAQQPTQQISATTELDLPQSGSENDDETWLTEPTECKTTISIEVAAEAINAAEACSIAKDPFHQHSKTQPVAEQDLPRTQDERKFRPCQRI